MSDTMQTTDVVASDPECLQCGQKRSTVRAESLYCCTISGYETPEVDQEWDRHRWKDWSDRELDRYGVKASAYAKHRKTDFGVLPWIDCDDTKRGHSPADEEAVGAMWADRVGQCLWCGQPPRNTLGLSR
jgi:hypothetical protein